MTQEEIYKLANELTEQQVDNIVFGWEKDNDTKQIKLYNSLIKLGDSKQLACATVIADRYNILN